jgi:hypothetical protein
MRFLAAIVFLSASTASAQIPGFKTQEIDASLKIGYGVILVDINDDKKLDIVVCDKERVIWFENPTWKLRVITEGKTTPDNVCIDAHDIDGDGKLDLALGAGWKPGNTKEPSTLQWLRRRKTLDEPWEMFPIAYEEPTLHRMRFADLDGDGSGKKVFITVPLMGRASTKEKNWAETGVKIQARRIPVDPTQPDWPTETLSDAFHVPHNFYVATPSELFVASYEGVSALNNVESKWEIRHFGEGDQSNPSSNRGASEIKSGKVVGAVKYTATIEPWHGNQIVVYLATATGAWKRTVIDDQLRWGHAIWCADLDVDGTDEIVVGVRDPLPGKAQNGVRVYRSTDATSTKWDKFEVDPGGVAVEDLAVADLNADGKPDIVAVGRQTKNVRIYWNQGK